MSTRYQQLRDAVDRLSWGADEQHAYLESILAPLSKSGSGVGYGNDELALELDDIFMAAGDMRQWGEISDAEVAAVKPLNRLLEGWSGSANGDFWRRACAKVVLAALPDEERDTGWQASL